MLITGSDILQACQWDMLQALPRPDDDVDRQPCSCWHAVQSSKPDKHTHQAQRVKWPARVQVVQPLEDLAVKLANAWAVARGPLALLPAAGQKHVMQCRTAVQQEWCEPL